MLARIKAGAAYREEVAAINLETHTEKVAIAVGDPISIIDGPFVGFSGKVQGFRKMALGQLSL